MKLALNKANSYYLSRKLIYQYKFKAYFKCLPIDPNLEELILKKLI